jgi:hypothetical protein
MSAPQTLFDISGIQARIFTLPGRPPFMTAGDLAEVYGTEPKRIADAVKRNPARFPDRYAFRLTEAEEAERWSQIATTSPGKRTDLRPLVFTHGGANMLAAVLRGDVADRMAVAINDAFSAVEAAALAAAQAMVNRLTTEQLVKTPLRMRVRLGVEMGLTFEAICKQCSAPKWKIAEKARECLAMGLIDRLPPGMPAAEPDLFSGD